MPRNDIDITKKAYAKDRYTEEQYFELAKCMVDPLYFTENYVMIQHALKGRVKFEPYDYQRKIIRAFHENKYSVVCTGRQLGKSLYKLTTITCNTEKINIDKLVYNKLSYKEKIVEYLEKWLVNLSID